MNDDSLYTGVIKIGLCTVGSQKQQNRPETLEWVVGFGAVTQQLRGKENDTNLKFMDLQSTLIVLVPSSLCHFYGFWIQHYHRKVVAIGGCSKHANESAGEAVHTPQLKK